MAEPDPPLAEIVKKSNGMRFETARRGYAPSQVDVFLLSIASQIESLERRLKEARSPDGGKKDAGRSSEDASGASKRVARLVEVTEREVARMREEAEAEAATTRSDAKQEADRITKDARDEATHAVEEVQAFLDHVDEDTRKISDNTDERRRQMTEEIRTMQERLTKVAKALDSVLDPKRP